MEQKLTHLQAQSLALMQACLGAISANFRMIWVEVHPNVDLIVFVLEKDLDTYREEISDIYDEFANATIVEKPFEIEIRIDNDRLDWPRSNAAQVIFRRRE